MQIVGLDCATDPRKVGLARSTWDASLRIHTARLARSRADVVDTIVSWLSAEPSGVLAVDAPLGWPVPFAEALHSQWAGR